MFGIGDFVNMCKDFLMLILGACSMAVQSLFSMPLFGSISVGQILLALISFSLIFGFILNIIKTKFGGN